MTIYLQSDKPTDEHLPNWLPAPPGPFNLTVRFYTPLAPVLDSCLAVLGISGGGVVVVVVGVCCPVQG